MKILFLFLFLIATYMQNNKFENITRTACDTYSNDDRWQQKMEKRTRIKGC